MHFQKSYKCFLSSCSGICECTIFSDGLKVFFFYGNEFERKSVAQSASLMGTRETHDEVRRKQWDERKKRLGGIGWAGILIEDFCPD